MKKTIIIFVVVLVLAIASYFLFLRKSDDSGTDETGTSGSGSGSGSKTKKITTSENPMPLKMGSGFVEGSLQNSLVMDIQSALNSYHKAGLEVDGKFGTETQKALVKFDYPVVIYWKHYSQITGKSVYVNGEKVTDTHSFWDWLF